MNHIFSKKSIDKMFEIGILIKAIFGFFEVLVGILLAVSGKLIVDNLIIVLTQQEIIEDPHDFFANTLMSIDKSFTNGGHIFAVAYLMFHGIIDIFLAASLLKNKLWAYPWAVAGFGAFIAYQLSRYVDTHSILLLYLSLFDMCIISLILFEYESRKRARHEKEKP